VDRGFSLIEVLFATTVTAISTVTLAQVSLQAVRAGRDASSFTTAALVASAKMEQLRGLTWTFDTLGNPVSDISTDTAVAPEQPSGGTGLSPGPAEALTENRPGYYDFVDRAGRQLGAGTTTPAGTAFIRRWSIEPLPVAPDESLVIQVSVTPVGLRSSGLARGNRRLRDETRVVSIKSRKGN
jgi:prepilin-type N-terminal cleavage/methylation domain-containing protein